MTAMQSGISGAVVVGGAALLCSLCCFTLKYMQCTDGVMLAYCRSRLLGRALTLCTRLVVLPWPELHQVDCTRITCKCSEWSTLRDRSWASEHCNLPDLDVIAPRPGLTHDCCTYVTGKLRVYGMHTYARKRKRQRLAEPSGAPARATAAIVKIMTKL